MQSNSNADGLTLHHDGRSVRLKWHKLRRQAGDIPFCRENLIAGLVAGAVMEVDIQLLADGEFVCLHDATLETQTDGIGRVDEADSETIRTLRQTDGAGATTGPAPLLLDELIAIIGDRAPDTASGATVQLDLKLSEEALSDPVAERFGVLVYPVAPRLSLSGEDWPAVRRLGGAVGGLSLGFDPMKMLIDDADAAADLPEFAARMMSLAPRAEMIYLHHSALAAARERRIDLVGAFQRAGAGVDCWTIGTDRDGTEAQLRLAVESGVDQITTDTPGDLQALWSAMTGRPD